jgi:hypothetical protein
MVKEFKICVHWDFVRNFEGVGSMVRFSKGTNLGNTKVKVLFLVLGIAVGLVVLGYLVPKLFWSASPSANVEIDWRLLGEMDYVTGLIPPSLKKYDGALVKVPGFMVPLEDNQKKVIQFLLVPTPQACIHVPPPPPNQMLLVDIKGGTDVAYGPIWIHGVLRIKTQRTMYGDVSYSFEATYIEPYQ